MRIGAWAGAVALVAALTAGEARAQASGPQVHSSKGNFKSAIARKPASDVAIKAQAAGRFGTLPASHSRPISMPATNSSRIGRV